MGLAGCAHEVARITKLNEGPNEAQVFVDDPQEPIRFGVRIDAVYSGRFDPIISIDLLDGSDAVVAHATCEPRRQRVSRACSMIIATGAHTNEHCGYGTSCTLFAPARGKYTVRAAADLGPHAPDLGIDRLELAIKR
jgi:hypothetical protein